MKQLFPVAKEISANIYQANIWTEAKPRSIWRGKYENGIYIEGNKKLIPEDAFIYTFPRRFLLSFIHGHVHARNE